MPRFTSPPASLLDRVSFKLTMEKNMKEYTSSTFKYSFDFSSCSNGYRTFCCSNSSVSVYF